MKKWLKRIGIVLLIAFIGIQFIRIDYINPPVNEGEDLFAVEEAPAHVEKLIRDACYDCHSNESKYPWYTQIAPVSWWVQDHIDHGRDELNYSKWGTFDHDRKRKKNDQSMDLLEKGDMPLYNYVWMHSEADLSEADKAELIAWFKEQNQKHND